MSERPRPRAYRLDDPAIATVPLEGEAPERPQAAVTIVEEPMEAIEAADGTVVPMGEKRRAPWLAILTGAVGALVAIAIGLAFDRLIADLFARAPWLGWVALALAAIALLAFLALCLRELRGIFRERRIERLREDAIAALAARDRDAARRVADNLVTLYVGRPETAAGRARIAESADDILEADDRLGIAERELLAALDDRAYRAIAQAAKQVSVVTAVSPRAIVDVAFVVFAGVRLLRIVSRIYGGRPGTLGFLRLARAALGHLAVTGGVAVGDSLIQQVVGLGVAARISAKLGEGVLNGLMTARFGLAALAVCRPLPFVKERPPKLSDVAGELLSGAEPEPR